MSLDKATRQRSELLDHPSYYYTKILHWANTLSKHLKFRMPGYTARMVSPNCLLKVETFFRSIWYQMIRYKKSWNVVHRSMNIRLPKRKKLYVIYLWKKTIIHAVYHHKYHVIPHPAGKFSCTYLCTTFNPFTPNGFSLSY